MSSISREQANILLNMMVDSLDEESAKEMLLKVTDPELEDNPLVADLVKKINEKFDFSSDKWESWTDVPESYTDDVNNTILKHLMSEENWNPEHANKLLWILLYSNDPIPNDDLRLYLSKLSEGVSFINETDLLSDLIERFISRNCSDVLYRFVDEDTKLVYKAYLTWEVDKLLPEDNMYSAFVKSFHNHVLWKMESFQVFFEAVCQKQPDLRNRIVSYVKENKENSFFPDYIGNL